MQKENGAGGLAPLPQVDPLHPAQHQYVGPYRLEKTLGKGQTGKWQALSISIS